MKTNSSEELLTILLAVYEKNNKEISMIECLQTIIDELELSESDVLDAIDSNIKNILLENSNKHRLFRKAFYKPKHYAIDI